MAKVTVDGIEVEVPNGSSVLQACEAAGKEITTIEGIPDSHPLIKAFAQLNVPSCGYCTPGQIMQAAALIKQKTDLEDEEIVQGMSGNICRCGAYQRIIAAVRQAAGGRR